LLELNLAQDIEKKKEEPGTPHFFSLNQDIVAWSEVAKVWIKVCNAHSHSLNEA
jgi:hypothetical protein